MQQNGVPCTVIIPVFNEGEQLCTLVEKINKKHPEVEVLIIDDGSTDSKTAVPYCKLFAKHILHPYNIGNGAAVKTGIRAAAGSDILIFMDGDGQHDPADIDKLLEFMDKYDMVVGARNREQHASLARGWMNRLYNRLASYVTGYPVADLTSGFRAMRAQTANDLLPLLPNGYSWPTTSTLVSLRSGLSIKYVPIDVRPRRHGCSRIHPLRDGIRFLLIIMKICTLYSPFRIFLPVSLTMFVLGLLNYFYTYFTSGRFTNMSALMLTTSVVIFMMGLVSEQISQIGLFRHQMSPSKHNEKHGTMEDNRDATERF